MAIIWLASYPKSGNTWLRAFISNYLHDGDIPVAINGMIGGSVHIERHFFDETMGVSSSELTAPEIGKYRRRFHRELASQFEPPFFVKTHDALCCPHTGIELYTGLGECKAVYIVRDPTDIPESFAHHENKSIDQQIEYMASRNSWMRGGSLLFPQFLGSWSDHVAGWIEQNAIETLLIKYEDMLSQPEETFARILAFSGLEPVRSKVEKAIDFSRFDRLRKSETLTPFAERQSTAKSFFRSGRAGSGRLNLSAKQIENIEASHGEMMAKLGYL